MFSSAQAARVGYDIVQYRDIRFEFSPEEAERYWFGGDPWLTHLFNGLFFAVPDGERWVMESARHQLPKIITPDLVDIVRAFIRQEATHSREHDAVNALMQHHGVPADVVEARFMAVRKKVQAMFGQDMQASIAAAIEHFTAILSEVMLQHPEFFTRMHPKMRALVYWHLVEETEHKGISFDIFHETVGTDQRAYLMRVIGLLATFGFGFPAVLGGQFYLLWHDRELGNWKSAKHYIKTTLVSPALLLKIVASGLPYLRRDFHPWQHDNRHIINIWRQEFARTQDPLAATDKLWKWQMQQKYAMQLPQDSKALGLYPTNLTRGEGANHRLRESIGHFGLCR